MNNVFNIATKKKWFINQKNQLCDEHHNVLVTKMNKIFNENEIKSLKQIKPLLNAISPIYLKKGIYIKIPLTDNLTHQNYIYHWYLINNEQLGFYCNHHFIDFNDDEQNFKVNSNIFKLNNDATYNNNKKSNDRLNNLAIGLWINDNYPVTSHPIPYNYVSYQEMTLEEFISQSLKILRIFEKYNPSIKNISKFNYMLNWES